MISRVVIAAVLLLLSTVTGNCDWPGKPYAQVRAYAYNSRGDIGQPIVTRGRLDRSVVNKAGIALTREQMLRLIAAVTGKHPIPEEFAACFSPRHAFVFYDAAKKPFAWVELCFECDKARVEPSSGRDAYDLEALKRLARELQLPLLPK